MLDEEKFELQDHMDCSVAPNKTSKFLFTELNTQRPGQERMRRSNTPPAHSSKEMERKIDLKKEQKTVKSNQESGSTKVVALP